MSAFHTGAYPKAASEPVAKLLKSAMANAENNLGMNLTACMLQRYMQIRGQTLKRFRPRAQGRAYRIRKRTSHISVVLDELK